MYSRKKIFDITPPAKEKTDDFIEKFLQKEDLSEKKPSSFLKKTVIVAIFIFIVLIFGCSFISPKAEVTIWPKTETLNFETELGVSTSASELDFSKQVVPAVVLSTELRLSQEFSSSVTTTEEKAEGIIRVYNQYSASVTLIDGTQFLASEADVRFLSQRKIIIPAGGYVDVAVMAARPGSDYNIGPCAFSIPNLRKFSPARLYYDVTGKSFSAMSGGRVEEISKITAQDLESAEKILTEEVFREGKAVLRDETSEDILILEETIEQEVLEVFSQAEVGQEVSTFNFEINVKTKAFGARQADFREFSLAHIESEISSQKIIDSESLDVNYSFQSIDHEDGVIILNLEGSAEIYSAVSKDDVNEFIKNRRPEEAIQSVLSNYPEISRLQVKLWPFWQKIAPKNPSRIEIEIKTR